MTTFDLGGRSILTCLALWLAATAFVGAGCGGSTGPASGSGGAGTLGSGGDGSGGAGTGGGGDHGTGGLGGTGSGTGGTGGTGGTVHGNGGSGAGGTGTGGHGTGGSGTGGSGTGGAGTGGHGTGGSGTGGSGTGGAGTGGHGTGGSGTGGTGGHGTGGSGTGGSGTGGAGGGVPYSAVQAIFDAHCITCHDATKVGLPANPAVPLTSDVSYSTLVGMPAMETCGGTRVVPGNSANSYLYHKVADATPCSGSQMPRPFEAGPTVPLSAADIATIKGWIDEGAPR